jgi:hypothetical protein
MLRPSNPSRRRVQRRFPCLRYLTLSSGPQRSLCVDRSPAVGLGDGALRRLGGATSGERLDALRRAPRAELLHVLMLPDFDHADRIGALTETKHRPSALESVEDEAGCRRGDDSGSRAACSRIAGCSPLRKHLTDAAQRRHD